MQAIATEEIFGTTTGGLARGALYEDLIDVGFELDAGAAAGLDGLSFRANAFLTHGRGASTYQLNSNILSVSNIEADRGDRLFNLWAQQRLLSGAVTIRVGQIAANEEFIVSRGASLFLNGSYGWPAIVSANLPSGGPNYPLATPGVRIYAALRPDLSFAVAAYNGDPAGPGPGTPLSRNRNGLAFRLGDDAFLIAETTYTYDQENQSALKLGAWLHTGFFSDQGRDAFGRSLADPASSGEPRRVRGNRGVYLVVDQSLVQSEQGALTAFLRAGAAPADRNLVPLYIDAGLNWRFADGSVLGLAGAYARISSTARDLDYRRRISDPAYPVRSLESDLELTYQRQLAPWWTLQPDLQIVFHPGGNIPAPGATAGSIPTALVLGLRTVISF